MRYYTKFFIATIVILPLVSKALLDANYVPSESDHENLAPLTKAQGSERLDGEYIVTLHDGHDLTSHFGYIERNLQAHPSSDWNVNWWKDANAYHVTHLTGDSLNQIRRDPGVRSVLEVEMLSIIFSRSSILPKIDPRI
ncbi:hypothetical protein K490DRAFT_57147 [Saccharata proteae CBS 121410]|uniref:Inhibitor I9 domain-containing protein n=1 Tax=Saccharata proteae CBS 121410 TaxID=1314787 RepID=A0A9P4LWZ0_9PEZI|nr:hypothetical protein K490DRAFT_57147 [Saccharata proteae CBS 121410]